MLRGSRANRFNLVTLTLRVLIFNARSVLRARPFFARLCNMCMRLRSPSLTQAQISSLGSCSREYWNGTMTMVHAGAWLAKIPVYR
jgi:hypothetical protein